MGLVSDGGVHSHVDHLRALVGLARREGVVARVHAITNGAADGAAPVTVCGRILAMDRDQRWEPRHALRAVVDGVGPAPTGRPRR